MAPLSGGPHEISDDETRDLLRRARAGDRGAVDHLVHVYLPRLRRWAAGRIPRALRDLADTTDIVQDVLLQTLVRPETLRAEQQGGLQAYLRQAVLNRVRDEFRRARRRPAIVELGESRPDQTASPLEAAIGRDAMDRYERALASLRPQEREAIIARIELGCTYAEVAELTGKPSANAARMTIQRALLRLVRKMGDARS